MQPIAQVQRELRVDGIGQLAIGVFGLAAALAIGVSPERALLPFAVAGLAMAGVQFAIMNRWLRREIDSAGPPATGAPLEPSKLTMRRSLIKLALFFGVLVLMVPFGLSGVFGGVVVGIGAIDFATSVWLGRQEQDRGVTVYREVGASPFSGGRRTIYTRPTSASTLET